MAMPGAFFTKHVDNTTATRGRLYSLQPHLQCDWRRGSTSPHRCMPEAFFRAGIGARAGVQEARDEEAHLEARLTRYSASDR